ncbi:hypothetical protein [Chryseobacterium sp.]|uniref:hypothetical protein n=1 Tax=Chryseobacterium sp. TaxID=1871047 RepID=UPI00388E4B44
MKKLYILILSLFSFFCFSQKNENLDYLLKSLNTKKYDVTIKSKKSKKQRYCLLSVLKINGYEIFYPLDLDINLGLGRDGATNILIFSEKKKQYLVLDYFSRGYFGHKSKYKYQIEFNFQGWDLINNQSILLDKNIKPIKHIFFPSELSNIKSEIKDNTMLVQNIDDNKSYDVTLDIPFYNMSLDVLFEYFYLKNQEEYLSESVEDNDFFIFLKQQSICKCN